MRKEEPDGFITHQLYFDFLLRLDNEALGAVYRNLIQTFIGEEADQVDNEAADVVVDIMNSHIQRDVESYTERCRINKENARKRWERLQSNANDATASDRIRLYTNDATASDRMRMDAYIIENNVIEDKSNLNVKEDKSKVEVKEDKSKVKVKVKEDIKDGCTLQADVPAALMPYTLLLKDGTYHRISESDFKNPQEAFPNVNLDTEFKKMVLWCSDPANAQKRKTKKGIMKFIRSWLGHTEKPVVIQKPEPANKVHEERRYDFDELEKILTGRG